MKTSKSTEPSRFLSIGNLSDDIRTPLNLTRMLLELLTESPVNPIQKAHIENALQNLGDIAVIIDQAYGLIEKESNMNDPYNIEGLYPISQKPL